MFTTKKTLPPCALLLHLAPDDRRDRLPETTGLTVSKSSDRSVFKVASRLSKVGAAILRKEKVSHQVTGWNHLPADVPKMLGSDLSSKCTCAHKAAPLQLGFECRPQDPNLWTTRKFVSPTLSKALYRAVLDTNTLKTLSRSVTSLAFAQPKKLFRTCDLYV